MDSQKKKDFRITQNQSKVPSKKEEVRQFQTQQIQPSQYPSQRQPVSQVDQLKKENDFLRSELLAAQEQIKILMVENKRLRQQQRTNPEMLMAFDMHSQMQYQQYLQFMQEACTPQPQFQTDNMTYEQILELQDRVGHVSRGLTKQQIKQIPKKVVFTKQKEPCTICYSDINRQEKVRELKCKHQYHSKCIKQWLLNEKKCPICKIEV